MKALSKKEFPTENVLVTAFCVLVSGLVWLLWPADQEANPRGILAPSHLAQTERVVHRWWPRFLDNGPVQRNLVVAPAPRPLITPAPGLPSSGFDRSGQVIVPPRAAPVGARVVIGGQAVDVRPNELGQFPRQNVGQQSTVQIQLRTHPGEPVGIQALDGGVVNGKVSATAQNADAQGQVGFEFTVAKNPGSYRVAILVNGDREFFDFWVGPPIPAPLPAKSI